MIEDTHEHRRLRRQERESKLIRVAGKVLPNTLGLDDYYYWMPLAIDNELLTIYGKEQGWDKDYNKPINEDHKSIKAFAEFVKNKIEKSIQISDTQIVEEIRNITIETILNKQTLLEHRLIGIPEEFQEAEIKGFKKTTLYDIAAIQYKDREFYNKIRNLKFQYKHLIIIPDDEFKKYYYEEW